MLEKDFENILVRYPELIEEGLRLISRQQTIFGRRMDLYFEDIHKRKLIVELKSGPILDKHIGQIIAYEGAVLSQDEPDIRIMLIGTRVPPNIRKGLDHHGIAWKEINVSAVNSFLREKADSSFGIEDEPLRPPKLPKPTKPPKPGTDKFEFRLGTNASMAAALICEGGHTMKELPAVNSAAHKMVQMMKDRGWLVVKDSGGKYSISGKVESSGN